jgi:hypothetical protein
MVDAGLLDALGGHVSNMEKGDRDTRLHVVGHEVHGVGADHQELGTGALEPLRRSDHESGRIIPSIFALQPLDEIEVERVHQ